MCRPDSVGSVKSFARWCPCGVPAVSRALRTFDLTSYSGRLLCLGRFPACPHASRQQGNQALATTSASQPSVDSDDAHWRRPHGADERPRAPESRLAIGKGAHYLSSCRRTSQPLQAVVGPPAWLVFRGHGAQLSVPWAACSTISSCSPPGEPLARVLLIGRHGTRRIDSDAGQGCDRRPDNGIPQSARKGSRREEPKRGACSAPCHGRQAERRLRERWVGLVDCGAGRRALRIERFSAQNLSGACAKLCRGHRR